MAKPASAKTKVNNNAIRFIWFFFFSAQLVRDWNLTATLRQAVMRVKRATCAWY